MKELKTALEGSDAEDIKKKTDALNEVAMRLATKVYENAAAANQNAGNTEETTPNNDKKDDVEEASYEEK